MDAELEEEFIPMEQNTEDDDQLDDVVVFDPAEAETQSVETEPLYSVNDSPFNNDGLYNDVSYATPTVPTGEMVDINPNHTSTVIQFSNELEEEYIPHEQNTADDDQLDDVTMTGGTM